MRRCWVNGCTRYSRHRASLLCQEHHEEHKNHAILSNYYVNVFIDYKNHPAKTYHLPDGKVVTW